MLKNKQIAKKLILIISMLLVFISTVFSNMETAYAHKTYYIDVTYNSRTHNLHYIVEKDSSASLGECGHTMPSRGIITVPESIEPTEEELEDDKGEKCKKLSDKVLVYNFNPQEHSSDFTLGQFPKNESSTEDFKRAEKVANTLVNNYNAAEHFVYDGVPAADLDEAVKRSLAMISLINGGSVNGATAKKGAPVKADKVNGVNRDDFISITKNGETRYFQYQMIKGYNSKGVEDKFDGFKRLKKGFDYSGDVTYMNWNLLVYLANYNYKTKGLTSDTNSEEVEKGLLTRSIIEFVEDMIYGIMSLLGLYSMHELIFNAGLRAEGFHYGIFSKSWKELIDQFYLLFSAIAMSLMMVALMKLLFTRTVSVVNPQMRVSLIEGIMQFIIAMALLAFFPMLLDFTFQLNAAFTGLFEHVGVDLENLDAAANYTSIGGLIFAAFHLFIVIRLNITYIMRGVMIAILMVAAPVFVSSLAFGGKYKEMFGTYIRELLGNVFMQTFQAFVITFLLSASTMTRTIELIVILLMIFVLNDLFRQMVFGSGGGLVNKMGGKAAVASVAGAAALGGAAVSLAKKGFGTGKDEWEKGGNNGNGGGSGNGSGDGSGSGGSGGEEQHMPMFTTPTRNTSGGGHNDYHTKEERERIDNEEIDGFEHLHANGGGSGGSSGGGFGRAAKAVTAGVAVGAAGGAFSGTKGMMKTGHALAHMDVDANAGRFESHNNNKGKPKNHNQHNNTPIYNDATGGSPINSGGFDTPIDFNTPETPTAPIYDSGLPTEPVYNGIGRTYTPENTHYTPEGQAVFTDSDLQEHGVHQIHASHNEVEVQFAQNQLDTTNQQYLQQLHQQWQSGGQGREALQQQGINDVYVNEAEPNIVQIKYNKHLSNIKDVHTTNNGVVVTPKNEKAPINVFKPVNLESQKQETPHENK